MTYSKKPSKLEGKYYYVSTTIRKAVEDIKDLIPYVEKTQHRLRLEAIAWELNYSLTSKEKK